jgi:DNA polymerase IV
MPALLDVPPTGYRRVLHCDLDCFFAAVEELDDPTLAGKPVIVGGDPDRRGVVSTANYTARRYGIHSAMSAALARRLCPHAIFLRPRYERYRELSHRVMAILDEYFVIRERVSIDEAYGELLPGVPGCRPAEQIAREIKARVRTETGLTISIGAGTTKSIAKLASDLFKPDGCRIVKPGTERAFLSPLAVGRLPGVGPHTSERLERLGILTVGQLAERDLAALTHILGKQGAWLWHLANAEDARPVVGDSGPPKSISRENTYSRDIGSLELAAGHVVELAADVAAAAHKEHVAGRTVTLKVKWPDFRVMTRQTALEAPTNDTDSIAATALALLHTEVGPRLESGGTIRLLGVGLSGFQSPGVRPDVRGWRQLHLFDYDSGVVKGGSYQRA